MFPGLAAALDPVVVVTALRDAGVEAEQARVLDLRYRPGRRCVLQYGIRRAGRTGESIYSGSMIARGETPVPPRRGRQDLALPDVTLAGLDVSLHAFPRDPELPAISRAMDPAEVAQGLAEATGQDLALTGARLLAYRPGLRATIGYDTEEGLALVGKVTRSRRARRLEADARLLVHAMEAAGAAQADVRLLTPVAALLSWPVVLYPRVHGESLAEKLQDGTAVPVAAALADTLAALHGLEVAAERERGLDGEAARVREHTETLAMIHPSEGSRLRRLGERLALATERSPSATASTATPTIVHGDFHDENVLVGEEGITLIDLEEAARGNPMIDVARLLGALRKRAVLEPALAEEAQAFSSAFLDAYEKRRPCDRALVAVLQAGLLLKSALHCFETQRPNWPAEIDRLLAEAEQVAGGCR